MTQETAIKPFEDKKFVHIGMKHPENGSIFI
jgi:hypothetical protein